jgi:hypothetical protein
MGRKLLRGQGPVDSAGEAQRLPRSDKFAQSPAGRYPTPGRCPEYVSERLDAQPNAILFATDGDALNEPGFCEPYFRFLETDDEYFSYAPEPIPEDGRWRIYGIDLPNAILGKVYYQNAARLLGIET